jgi:hypothetical protein
MVWRDPRDVSFEPLKPGGSTTHMYLSVCEAVTRMDADDAIYRAARVIFPHRDAVREAVDYILGLHIPPLPEWPNHEDGIPLTTEVRVHVYYYVGNVRMTFTLVRTRTRVAYFPPTPHVDAWAWGGPEETVDPADVAARVERDTADMDVFDQWVRLRECIDAVSISYAFGAAEATTGFWSDARHEFVRATWAPERHVDWCMPHDERGDLLADLEVVS